MPGYPKALRQDDGRGPDSVNDLDIPNLVNSP